MKKNKDRFSKAETSQPENLFGKNAGQLRDANIHFDVSKLFYPSQNTKTVRRYSIDDNGGGYLGL